MILPDVNVLIYAHRKDTVDHVRYRQWLEAVINSPRSYALSDLVLSSFLRIVTNPKIFKDPTSLKTALAFIEDIRNQPHVILVAPGQRHWKIFQDLCVKVAAKGNLVPDAYLAALAIESGCDWITTDRDYSRFPGLIWRHPLTGV